MALVLVGSKTIQVVISHQIVSLLFVRNIKFRLAVRLTFAAITRIDMMQGNLSGVRVFFVYFGKSDASGRCSWFVGSMYCLMLGLSPEASLQRPFCVNTCMVGYLDLLRPDGSVSSGHRPYMAIRVIVVDTGKNPAEMEICVKNPLSHSKL